MAEHPKANFVPITVSFVAFFALREIVAEMAEAKGDAGDAWKKRLDDRITTELSKFSSAGKPIDPSRDPETRAIIRALLRDPKRDAN